MIFYNQYYKSIDCLHGLKQQFRYQHFGRPEMTAEKFAYAQMHTAENSIAYLFDHDEHLIKDVHTFRKEMGYLPFIKFMEIEPGLKPLIDRLRSDYKTAVATNRTDTMPHVLKTFDLEDRFDLVVTALDVDRPNLILTSLKK